VLGQDANPGRPGSHRAGPAGAISRARHPRQPRTRPTPHPPQTHHHPRPGNWPCWSNPSRRPGGCGQLRLKQISLATLEIGLPVRQAIPGVARDGGHAHREPGIRATRYDHTTIACGRQNLRPPRGTGPLPRMLAGARNLPPSMNPHQPDQQPPDGGSCRRVAPCGPVPEALPDIKLSAMHVSADGHRPAIRTRQQKPPKT